MIDLVPLIVTASLRRWLRYLSDMLSVVVVMVVVRTQRGRRRSDAKSAQRVSSTAATEVCETEITGFATTRCRFSKLEVAEILLYKRLDLSALSMPHCLQCCREA
jgi:hypothetical protein